eukprot:5688978-Alexandrium_andersonii.AAC.1
MSASLVGSEMCIRDRAARGSSASGARWRWAPAPAPEPKITIFGAPQKACLLYTSDAADDM